MSYSIVIDFDGTITTDDLAEFILHHFAEGDWKAVEERAVAGEITMDQCMRQQYGMIRGDPHEIMAKSEQIGLRSGFLDFYQFAKQEGLDMVCLSAGLSFLIESIFEQHGIDLDVVAPQAELTEDGIELDLVDFPNGYTDFKHYHVKQLQEQGRHVIYIGDGTSDFGGIVHADSRYVIEDSSLARLCEEQGLSYVSFHDFTTVKTDLQSVILQ